MQNILLASLLVVCACGVCACGGPRSSSPPNDGDASSTNNDGTTGTPNDVGVTNPGDMGTTSPGDAAVIPAASGVTITVEPDGTKVAQNLLTAIENATTSVHMEMYLLTNSSYLSALDTLHGKGIDVKVVLNQTFPMGTATDETNAATYTKLSGEGVDVHWAPTTTGFDGYTHEKTVIIDAGTAHAQAWIMTMNLDTDAPKYNREYLALDTIAADVAEAEAIFEADYASTKITPTGNLVVAPSPQNNAEKSLLNLIDTAKTSVDVEVEEFDASGIEQDISLALEQKAKAGVAVRMVLEDSTDADQATAVSSLQTAGGKVVGYVYSATALDIHAKTIIVDGTTVFIGSENLSGGSLGYNRELGVIFDEPSEVAKVQTTFNSDFAGGSAYSSK